MILHTQFGTGISPVLTIFDHCLPKQLGGKTGFNSFSVDNSALRLLAKQFLL